eukprot:981714_1
MLLPCIQILQNPLRSVVPDECQDLLCKLIDNELHQKSSKEFHVYATDTFHEFCIHKEWFYARKDLFRTNLSFLTDLFCVKEFPDWDWIDLEFVMTLYPNLERLTYLFDIELCEKTMEEIYKLVSKNKQWSLKYICIEMVKSSDFAGVEVVKKYEEK